jgi:hypothetical protein
MRNILDANGLSLTSSNATIVKKVEKALNFLNILKKKWEYFITGLSKINKEMQIQIFTVSGKKS